ncbi:MAG: hypothetical protein ACI9YH_003418, partial [Colwellia sp.]
SPVKKTTHYPFEYRVHRHYFSQKSKTVGICNAGSADYTEVIL